MQLIVNFVLLKIKLGSFQDFFVHWGLFVRGVAGIGVWEMTFRHCDEFFTPDTGSKQLIKIKL